MYDMKVSSEFSCGNLGCTADRETWEEKRIQHTYTTEPWSIVEPSNKGRGIVSYTERLSLSLKGEMYWTIRKLNVWYLKVCPLLGGFFPIVLEVPLELYL